MSINICDIPFLKAKLLLSAKQNSLIIKLLMTTVISWMHSYAKCTKYLCKKNFAYMNFISAYVKLSCVNYKGV